jgi:DNA polymerase III subunit epsilon
MKFLGDADIIAHNAPFDFGFLDAELFRCQRPPLDRRRMIDSLAMAKTRFPGMPNNLDALCRRLGVDNSMRGNHNAVLDCQLLAQVYLEMMGGKQPGLELAAKAAPRIVNLDVEAVERDAVLITPSADALAAHEVFVSGKVKEALWLKSPFTPEGSS